MKTFSLLLLLLILSFKVSAQNPTVQDCLGAVPICKDVYTEPTPYKYRGFGNYFNEIFYVEIQLSSERNCTTQESCGVWYIFTVQTTGMLRFTVTPDKENVDYDWSVFDFTNLACSDLKRSDIKPISSNTYGYSEENGGTDPYRGYTGANSLVPGASGSCNGPGTEFGSPWNDDIPVIKGHTYVLYISNWSAIGIAPNEIAYGYKIDFSQSTAKIYDDVPPQFAKINTNSILPCGTNTFTVGFSENVECNTLNVSDFTLTDGTKTYTISSIYNAACAAGSGIKARDYQFTTAETLPPGNYKLIFKGKLIDACGNYTENDLINFEVKDIEILSETYKDISCYGAKNGSINLVADASANRISYSITNGSVLWQTGTFTSLPAGNYQPYYKNQNGCTKLGTPITIKEPSPISIQKTDYNSILCYGQSSAAFSITANGGTPPYKYSSNNGLTYTNSFIFDAKPAGTYIAKVTDANSCVSSSITFTITQPTEIQATSTIQSISCYGDTNGKISITASGGTGNLTYKLDNTLYQTSPIFEFLAPNSYIVTIKDDNTCTKNLYASIYEPSILTIDYLKVTDVTCAGKKNGKIEYQLKGGTYDYNVVWIDANQNTIKKTIIGICIPVEPFPCPLSFVDKLDIGIYQLKTLDRNACTYTNEVEIKEPAALSIEKTTIINVTCNGGYDGSISNSIIGGTIPYTYAWINYGTEKDIFRLRAGIYSFSVTDSKACQVQKEFTVTQPEDFSLKVKPKNTTCYQYKDGALSLQVLNNQNTTNLKYEWSNGATTDNISDLSIGYYEIKVTDLTTKVCAIAGDTIRQPDSLQIVLKDLKKSCNETASGELKFFGRGGTSPYQLTSSVENQFLNVDTLVLQSLRPDTYIVNISDSHQCINQLKTLLISQECDFDIIVPNVFTPNGDLKNDIVKVRAENMEIGKFYAEIYTRWGQKIHTSTEFNNMWDGKISGKTADDGVYYYCIQAYAKHSTKAIVKKGFLHLIK